MSNLETGEWRLQKQFRIEQRTSLANGGAKMTSVFSFDTDGTIDMDFGYTGTIEVSNFYTALTNGNSKFTELTYPVYKVFSTTASGADYRIPLSEGKITQLNSSEALGMTIRFTKFNNRFTSRKAVILDSSYYKKFYYGILYGTPKVIPALTFSKSIDFTLR